MRISEIVAQASSLQPPLRRTGILPVSSNHTLNRQDARSTFCPLWACATVGATPLTVRFFAATVFFFLSSCTSPRIVEVSSRTRLQDITPGNQHLFVADRASRLRYQPHDLPVSEQREEFSVRWRGAGIDLVKFEYRQVDKPNTVKEQMVVLQSPGRSGLPAATGQSYRARKGAPTLPVEPGTVNREPGTVSHVFEIRGKDFRDGGPVSAWRVSLWNGGELVAERKSALW